MSHANRGRLAVEIAGPWTDYTGPIDGWVMLGTVTRGQETGALGRFKDGQCAIIKGGRIEPLNERKLRAAMDEKKK